MNVAGSNVRTVRQQLGMSLRAAADAAGIDPATLSRIENGKQNLTEELAAKIGSVLHTSPGMLFADPATVEMAMLHMRKVPVLTPEQLLEWTGPDDFVEEIDQRYLHCEIEVGSRYMFGYAIPDQANAPSLEPGDIAIFDSKRKPVFGEIVLGQTKDAKVHVGRLRTRDNSSFQIVPVDRLVPEVDSAKSRLLVVRGVLAERRTYYKPNI